MVSPDDVIELLELAAPGVNLGGLGIGTRFSQAIERVRAIVNQQGTDRIRTLKDMMKSALMTYVQNTHDVITGRDIFHRAIMAGGDAMLTVTGAAILANALSGRHKDQAKTLMTGVASRLSGPQRVGENASSAAVSVGSIATTPGKKKKPLRRDSIFAEKLTWDDLIGQTAIMEKLSKIAVSGQGTLVENVLVDPVTAELVLAVHDTLTPDKKRQYESKTLQDMIRIAERAVQRGIIQVAVE